MSLEGATGTICHIGLFTTSLDTWVGRPEFENEPLHVWVAVLMWTKGNHGKRLVIFDSNSDRLPEREVNRTDLEQGKQRNLIRHLEKVEKYKINEIWVGGEGNNDDGICLELTATWILDVAKAGRLDIDELKKKGFRRVKQTRRAPKHT